MYLQFLLHLLGDYVLQNDWMAKEKGRNTKVAILHATLYTLPFLLLTTNIIAILIIGISHCFIDRFGLARYLVWAKNQVAPKAFRAPWYLCSTTGFRNDTPNWLATGVLIVVDNFLHLSINAAVIYMATTTNPT
jgi:Protein of unknown function (DUF3307)